MNKWKRGLVLWTGEKSGYVLTKDKYLGEAIFFDDFMPFGGEPMGQAGQPMQDGLAKAMKEAQE